MSRSDIHILATRTLTLDTPQKTQLQTLSIHMETRDFISITSTINTETQKRLNTLFTQKNTAIICTSRNALKSINAHFSSKILEKTQSTFYCIGENTTALTQQLFPNSHIYFLGNNAEEGIRNLKSEDRKTHFFHIFSGNLSLDSIPAYFVKHHIPYEKYALYKTVFTPSLITKKYDAVIFKSPSAVHSFFSVNKAKNHNGIYICIGMTTQKALCNYAPQAPIYIPKTPTTNALIETLCTYFKSSSLCPLTP